MALPKTAVLESVRKRIKSGSIRTGDGVGVASDYVQTLIDAAGNEDRLSRFLSAHNMTAMAKSLKAAGDKLVYTNDEMGIFGGTTEAKTFGESKRKNKDLTPSAIMVCEYIATTRKRDRDKDVLEPIGANIDPKAPYLWQHFADMPVGPLVEIIGQNEQRIELASAIGNTKLGNDAVTLIEMGALRISHGFSPIEFEPLKDDSGIEYSDGGWHIKTYDLMETSLVSIPSNTDAVITAFSRQKLHDPVVKLWGGHLHDSRPSAVKSGWDPYGANAPVINVNLNMGELITKAVGRKIGNGNWYVAKPNGSGGWYVEDESSGLFQQYGSREEAEAAAEGLNSGTVSLQGWGRSAKPRKDGEMPKVPAEAPPVEKPAEVPEKTPEETDSDKDTGVLFTEIDKLFKQLGKIKGLPREAADRVAVAAGLMETASEEMDQYSSDLQSAAADKDLAGVLDGVQGLINDVVQRVERVEMELATIMTIQDVPDEAADLVNQILTKTSVIIESMNSIMNAGQADDPTPPTAADDESVDSPGGEEPDMATGLRMPCAACKGMGVKAGVSCASCKGTGEVAKMDDDMERPEDGDDLATAESGGDTASFAKCPACNQEVRVYSDMPSEDQICDNCLEPLPANLPMYKSTGKKDIGYCPDCGGSGQCPVCAGSGKDGVAECVACEHPGDGMCSRCAGTGYADDPEYELAAGTEPAAAKDDVVSTAKGTDQGPCERCQGTGMYPVDENDPDGEKEECRYCDGTGRWVSDVGHAPAVSKDIDTSDPELQAMIEAVNEGKMTQGGVVDYLARLGYGLADIMPFVGSLFAMFSSSTQAPASKVPASGKDAKLGFFGGGDESMQPCPKCKGAGEIDGQHCEYCNGAGELPADNYGTFNNSARPGAAKGEEDFGAIEPGNYETQNQVVSDYVNSVISDRDAINVLMQVFGLSEEDASARLDSGTTDKNVNYSKDGDSGLEVVTEASGSPCQACEGMGVIEGMVCPTCSGDGVVESQSSGSGVTTPATGGGTPATPMVPGGGGSPGGDSSSGTPTNPETISTPIADGGSLSAGRSAAAALMKRRVKLLKDGEIDSFVTDDMQELADTLAGQLQAGTIDPASAEQKLRDAGFSEGDIYFVMEPFKSAKKKS